MELKHKVLRGWCIELTKVIDYENTGSKKSVDYCKEQIKDCLNMFSKSDQQEILQDTDLKGFLESFGEFKKLIKV